MGKPAATISHMHVCPKVTGKVPHVGGPVVSGSANVFIGGKPAARVGDTLVCVGPPDKITQGSSGVFINGKPSARLGDGTAHGGKIVAGEATVMVGEKASAAGVPAKVAEVIISQVVQSKVASKTPLLAIAEQLRLDTQLVAFFKEAATGDIAAAAKNLVDQVAKKINAVDLLGAVARSQGINVPSTDDVINGELGKIFQTGCMQPGGIFNGKPLPENIFDVVDTVGPMLGVDMKKYAAIKGVANLNFDQVNVRSVFKAIKTVAPLFDIEVNDLGKILGKDYAKVLKYYGKLKQYGDEIFKGDFFKSLPDLPASMDDVLASADIPPYNFVMPEGGQAEDEPLTDEFMDGLLDDVEEDPFSEYLAYVDTGEWNPSKVSDKANNMIMDEMLERSIDENGLWAGNGELWRRPDGTITDLYTPGCKPYNKSPRDPAVIRYRSLSKPTSLKDTYSLSPESVKARQLQPIKERDPNFKAPPVRKENKQPVSSNQNAPSVDEFNSAKRVLNSLDGMKQQGKIAAELGGEAVVEAAKYHPGVKRAVKSVELAGNAADCVVYDDCNLLIDQGIGKAKKEAEKKVLPKKLQKIKKIVKKGKDIKGTKDKVFGSE